MTRGWKSEAFVPELLALLAQELGIPLVAPGSTIEGGGRCVGTPPDELVELRELAAEERLFDLLTEE